MQLSQEKGASIWLTTLPLDQHNFSLHALIWIQRYYCSSLRSTVVSCTIPLQVWKYLQRGTCLVLSHWWLSHYSSQRSEGSHSKFFTTSLPWCRCGTSPTTFDWGEDGP
jgi:hypothetical protein